MNEVSKGPHYGSPSRFPPSDDDLSIYDKEDTRVFYDSFPAQFQHPDSNKTSLEVPECGLCGRIWNIFCECRCRCDD